MTNVLLNPGFEDGTGSWTYMYDGSSAFTADTVSPYSGTKCAKCDITVIGTYCSLYQINFPFVPNTQYRLTFAAYSNNSADIDIYILKHTVPYTIYGLWVTANLTNEWKLYTYNFTTNEFASNNARLFFDFNPYAVNDTIYYIDQVNLQKVSEINPQMFALF